MITNRFRQFPFTKSYFADKFPQQPEESIGDYTLSEAARNFSEIEPNKNITNLLNAVTNFRALTASEYKKEHEKLSPEKIGNYLDTLGEALKTYHTYLENAPKDHPKTTEISDAFKFAKQAINDTLEKMGKEKKPDKIYVYYSNNDSLLKNMLQENQQATKKHVI